MTTAQSRAIEVSRRDRLCVVGHGTRKADGQPVYLVPSRTQPNRLYVVANEGAHLSCDCPAGRYGRVCAHRACVHLHLLAAKHAPDGGALLRDNRPMSIWK